MKQAEINSFTITKLAKCNQFFGSLFFKFVISWWDFAYQWYSLDAHRDKLIRNHNIKSMTTHTTTLIGYYSKEAYISNFK